MTDGKSKIQPGLLRKMNERRILEVIQDRGPLSRAEVRRYSGISAPTVSKTVAALLDAQLLEESEVPPTAPGRPSKLLRLARETVQVMGVVVDAKRCWVGAAGLDGHLIDGFAARFPTPGTYEGLVDSIQSNCRELMKRRDVPTLGMGVSIPG
ncbi:MAG: MarR family transcriptional regulator, partial [Planctomycetales bacterium]